MDTGQGHVVPDTKDWTWVLERRCPECGLTAGGVPAGALSARLDAAALPWREVLARPDATARPRQGVWSPLEYACHVRDVHRVFGGRVLRMLAEDDPVFPDWDQDAAAREGGYAGQAPGTVAGELAEAASGASAVYAGVRGEAWDRPGRRSNGSVFTIVTLGRYHLHDVVHHLSDVGHRQPAAAH